MYGLREVWRLSALVEEANQQRNSNSGGSASSALDPVQVESQRSSALEILKELSAEIATLHAEGNLVQV